MANAERALEFMAKIEAETGQQISDGLFDALVYMLDNSPAGVARPVATNYPSKLTEEMKTAAWKVDGNKWENGDIDAIWSAMLAASPAAPVPAEAARVVGALDYEREAYARLDREFDLAPRRIGCSDEAMNELDVMIPGGVPDEEAARALAMPDDRAAIETMFSAYQRLKKLGWNDSMYAPKDGTSFQVIENGSTGVFDCWYSGEWPDGHFMVCDGGDGYPSSIGPALFKLYPKDEAARVARMDEAAAEYRARANAEQEGGK